MTDAARWLDRLPRVLREYMGELSSRDLRRLFDREATEAYRVLTRDQAAAAEPEGWFKRFFHRVKLVFLGLSAKLTPPRRLLLLIAMAAAVLGLVQVRAVLDSQHLVIDFTPFWFLLSVGSLTYLLALELVDRVRVRDELEVARALQRDLLPQTTPELPGYKVAHSYQTANEVGGDYYDFLPAPDGRTALVIGDASGHGIAAGLLMAIANATLKLALDLDAAPEKVAGLLNRVLYRTGDRRAFMSLFLGLLEPATGRLDFVCAGHPFPLLRRASGEILELGNGGLPLGIRPAVEVAPQSVVLEHGDLVVLYTDGFPEATNAAGDAFGYERLRVLLSGAGSYENVHDRTLRAFEAYRGDEPLRDDACLVVIERV